MVFAVIAAGEGSRLRAEGISVSKPLVSIQGVPMIERLIGLALKNGASSFCCIVNEQAEDLREYFLTKTLPIPCHVITKSTPSSMHSLFALSPLLKEGRFCLTTTDAVFREDEFRQYLEYASTRTDVDGILAVTDFIDDEQPLCVEMDEQNRIRTFSDTQGHLKYATGGIYYFSPAVFDVMDQAIDLGMNRLRNFLRHLLACGYVLEGYPFSRIVDIDHIQDIAVAERFLDNHAASPMRREG